jgi:hypothetical protein
VSLSGLNLTLLIGPTVPVPAPRPLLEALESIEVTQADEGRSGFQMIFKLGKGGQGFMDYALFAANPLLRISFRVIVVLTVGAIPQVLMDGIITDQQVQPAQGDTPTTLTITGEDISVMMDREEKDVEHPAQPEMVIALKIIAQYARFGLIPLVIPPPSVDVPIPVERTPVQQTTDLKYLAELAERFAYVFYVVPGPLPATNTAYWGPPIRIGIPQPALTVDMGAATNVESINFQYDGLKATRIAGSVQDRQSNQRIPVQTFLSTRPPLAALPALMNVDFIREKVFRAEAGLNVAQAMAQAQAETEQSTDVVTAEGEVNAVRYGHLLQARGLVGLRGAGYSYDGLYYVKQVATSIRKGEVRQKFTLTREGLGSTVPVVIP